MLEQHRWVQGWHVNASHVLFGGQILAWVDEDCTMLACNNSINGTLYVSCGMERVRFHRPSMQGQRLRFRHQIVYLGKTSLWIWTEVHNEKEELVFSCYSSIVAVDMTGKPQLLDNALNANIRDNVQRTHHWETVEMLKELMA